MGRLRQGIEACAQGIRPIDGQIPMGWPEKTDHPHPYPRLPALAPNFISSLSFAAPSQKPVAEASLKFSAAASEKIRGFL